MQRKQDFTRGLGLPLLTMSALLSTWNLRAMAQDAGDPPLPGGANVSPAPGRAAPPPQDGGPGGARMGMGASAIAANGIYLYVLNGNTIYRLRASDMVMLTRRILPLPGFTGSRATAPPPASDLNGPAIPLPDGPPPVGPDDPPVGAGAPPASDPNGPAVPGGPPPPIAPNTHGGRRASRGSAPGRPGRGAALRGAQPGMMVGPDSMGGAAITISGTSVYVLRGNMLYRLRATDLALVAQKPLYAPSTPGGAGAPPPPGGATNG